MASLADMLSLEPLNVPEEAYYAPALQGLGKQLLSQDIPFRGVDLSGGERFLLEAGKGFGGTLSSVLGQRMAGEAQAQMQAQMQSQKIKELLLTRALEQEDLAKKQEFELEKALQVAGVKKGALSVALDKDGKVTPINKDKLQSQGVIEELGGLPPGIRGSAVKELETKVNADKIKADIQKTFQDISKMSPVLANLPYAEQEAELEAARGKLIALARSLFKDQMSDNERKRLEAMSPAGKDLVANSLFGQDRLGAKYKQFMSFVESRSGGTPIIDALQAGKSQPVVGVPGTSGEIASGNGPIDTGRTVGGKPVFKDPATGKLFVQE